MSRLNWYDWSLIGLWAFAGLSTVAMIGKPRKPTTPGAAVITVMVAAALIVGLVLTR